MKRILITNLWWVTIIEGQSARRLRLHCHALLIEPHGPQRPEEYELRGFGTEAAWPVFDIAVPSLDHEIRDDRLMFSALANQPPVPPIELVPEDGTRPLCVRAFDGEINEVWAALEESVARHWHAPFIPRLVHMPPEAALAHPSPARARGMP